MDTELAILPATSSSRLEGTCIAMMLQSKARAPVHVAPQPVATFMEVVFVPLVHRTEPAAPYYRPELDILRFLAFFLVFNHHILTGSATASRFHFIYALQEGGAGGVCLFFTLSAFLITELLLREQESTGSIHIPSFYLRRILRIWPLYFAAIAASAVLSRFSRHFGSTRGLLLPFLLLCGNWVIALRRGWPATPLLAPLWSISIEEQFYLLWPAILARWGRRAVLPAACLVLPIAWTVDLLLPFSHSPGHPFVRDPQLWLNSFSQFQFFALGAVLALYTHRRRCRMPALARAALLLCGFSLLLAAGFPLHFLNPAPPPHFGQLLAGYLSLDAACALLLLATLGIEPPPICRPLIYLGRISYGLYVFHFVVRLTVGTLLAEKLRAHPMLVLPSTYLLSLLLTIAMAAVSYHFFERPFLRLKERFTFVRSRPV